MLQDSDWEEVQAEDVEAEKDLLYSAGATSFGRPTHEHLEAMAKVFNEVLFFPEIFKSFMPFLSFFRDCSSSYLMFL